MNPRAFLWPSALTILYVIVMQSLPTFAFERWQVIAFFNSVIAVVLLVRSRMFWYLIPLFIGLALGTLSEAWWMALVVAVAEEVIFRFALFNYLQEKMTKYWAIYISALLFAVAHISFQSPYPPLGPFLLGLATAWIYQRTGRLSFPIVLHATLNAGALVLYRFAPEWLDRLGWLYQSL